jgi:hypothetical protein
MDSSHGGWFRRVVARPFLVVVVLLLAWVTYSHPYHNGPAIRSDGTGYHLWTRAILAHDFKFCDFLDRTDVDVRAAASDRNSKTGYCAVKYPPGVALLQLPLMFPFVDTTSHRYRISPGEHQMCLVAGALSLFVMMLLLSKVMASLRVRPSFSEAALVLISFGAGLFHHATYDSSLSHIYSALELTILIALFVPLRGKTLRPWKAAIALGTSALLILTRNVNAIPLVWAFFAVFHALKWKLPATIRLTWPVIVGAASGLAMQLAYNSVAAGKLTLSSYGKEAFLWSRPMWGSVLFSYEKGLFTYYPIVFVVIVAGVMIKRTRIPTFYFAGCIGSYAAVYGFWWCWYLGGFGHRGFVELMPFAVVILGCVLQNLSVWPRRTLMIVSAAAAMYTVQFMLRYWLGDAVWGLVTKKIYDAQLADWDRLSWLTAAMFGLLVVRNWKSSSKLEAADTA